MITKEFEVSFARNYKDAELIAKRKSWSRKEWRYICRISEVMGLKKKNQNMHIVFNYDVDISYLETRGFLF